MPQKLGGPGGPPPPGRGLFSREARLTACLARPFSGPSQMPTTCRRSWAGRRRPTTSDSLLQLGRPRRRPPRPRRSAGTDSGLWVEGGVSVPHPPFASRLSSVYYSSLTHISLFHHPLSSGQQAPLTWARGRGRQLGRPLRGARPPVAHAGRSVGGRV